MQPGDPAFGSPLNRLHIFRAHVELHDFIQEYIRFRKFKPQIPVRYLI